MNPDGVMNPGVPDYRGPRYRGVTEQWNGSFRATIQLEAKSRRSRYLGTFPTAEDAARAFDAAARQSRPDLRLNFPGEQGGPA